MLSSPTMDDSPPLSPSNQPAPASHPPTHPPGLQAVRSRFGLAAMEWGERERASGKAKKEGVLSVCREWEGRG